MSVSIARLRLWFVLLAALLVLALSGYYVRSRIARLLFLRHLPARVGINIEKTSENFTFSRSEGGRTLFTIQASRATQFKSDGHAELNKVCIVVYGRQGDRYDRIAGEHFLYDQKAGTVVSTGPVEIDLENRASQSAAAGCNADTEATPQAQRAANEIHLSAEGLSFNQKTGVAETDGLIGFQLPQAAGTARGARFDSRNNELVLRSAVSIQTEGHQPTHLEARQAILHKEPRLLALDDVQVNGPGRRMSATQALVYVSEDNAIDHIDAIGNVNLADRDGVEVRAPRGQLKLGVGNRVESAWFTGGVDFRAAAQASQGHANELLLHFVSAGPTKPSAKMAKLAPTPAEKRQLTQAPKTEAEAQRATEATLAAEAKLSSAAGAAAQRGLSASPARLDTILARGNVLLHQEPRAGSQQATTMTAEAITFRVKDGKRLSAAETAGAGRVVIRSAKDNSQTTIDAHRFNASFSPEGRPQMVKGVGGTAVQMHRPGEPDRLSTSDLLTVDFNSNGEIAHAVQEGNFRYREAAHSKNEPGGRQAASTHASYSAADEVLTLTGAPRVIDGGLTVTADTVRILRQSGEASASGNVKSTYSELKPTTNGALLASSEPVHVTAPTMTMKQASGTVHYSGGARLWQGANVIAAPSLDFDQKARSIVAFGDRHRPVNSLFAETDKKGKTSLITVSAPRLNYDDATRLAHYSGGVTARGESGRLTASEAEIYLSAAGHKSSTSRPAGGLGLSAAPSQLDRIVASGRVMVEQKGRRAEGERLLYTAATETYVMSGGTPTLSDPVNGTVRGDSLTFYAHDDRVVVEGKGSSRAVTHTYVSH